MSGTPLDAFQDLLQKAITEALGEALLVTGWVASVEILQADSRRVVTVGPTDQSPALAAGIMAYGKQAVDAIVSGDYDYNDDEES